MPAHSLKKTSRNRKHKGAKLLLVSFLTLSFFVLLTGSVVQLLRAWEARIWKGDERLTLVVWENPPILVSYQEGARETVFIPVPENLEVTAAFGLGRWKVQSLYELSRQRGMGGQLLVTTLASSFGIPINGWTKKMPGIVSLWDTSNLTLFDRIRVAATFLRIGGTGRKEISLEARGLVERSVLPTSELGFVIRKTGENIPELVDLEIANERVGVGIINSSGIGGLGGRVSRLVQGLGAPVLWVKTEGREASRCTVSVDLRFAKSKTGEKLRRLLACERYEAKAGLASSLEIVLGEGIGGDFPVQ